MHVTANFHQQIIRQEPQDTNNIYHCLSVSHAKLKQRVALLVPLVSTTPMRVHHFASVRYELDFKAQVTVNVKQLLVQ